MSKRNHRFNFGLCFCLWLGSLLSTIAQFNLSGTHGNRTFGISATHLQIVVHSLPSGTTYRVFTQTAGQSTKTYRGGVTSQNPIENEANIILSTVKIDLRDIDEGQTADGSFPAPFTVYLCSGGSTFDAANIINYVEVNTSHNVTATKVTTGASYYQILPLVTVNLSFDGQLPDDVLPHDFQEPDNGDSDPPFQPTNLVPLGLDIPEQNTIEGQYEPVEFYHQPDGTDFADAIAYQVPYEDIYGKTNPLISWLPESQISAGDKLWFPQASDVVDDAVKHGTLSRDVNNGWVWTPEGFQVLASQSQEYVPTAGDGFTIDPTTNKYVDDQGIEPKPNTILLTKTTDVNGSSVVSQTTINNNTTNATTNNYTSQFQDEELSNAEGQAVGMSVRFAGDSVGAGAGRGAALLDAQEFAPPPPEEFFTDYGGDLSTLFQKMEFFAQGSAIPQLNSFTANLPMPWGVVPMHIDLGFPAVSMFRMLCEFALTLYAWKMVFKICSI